MNQTPSEIFSFMSANHIGEKVALFWIAWAFIEEKNGNTKTADQIYVKGLRYLAEPRDLLNKRYHQFQRRMTRKYLSGESDGVESQARQIEPPRSFGNNAGLRAPLSAAPQRRFGEPIAASNAASTPFTIFVDPGDAPANNDVNIAIWPNLGSESERKKENEGIVLYVISIKVFLTFFVFPNYRSNYQVVWRRSRVKCEDTHHQFCVHTNICGK